MENVKMGEIRKFKVVKNVAAEKNKGGKG